MPAPLVELTVEEDTTRILGFWQPGHQFDYGMVVGGFNRQRYLTRLVAVSSTSQSPLH